HKLVGITDQHLKNKMILTQFASLGEVPFVPLNMIDAVYDSVTQNIKFVHEVDTVGFVVPDVKFTRTRKVNNFDATLIDSGDGSVTYLPNDPREWTGVLLKPNAEYVFKA